MFRLGVFICLQNVIAVSLLEWECCEIKFEWTKVKGCNVLRDCFDCFFAH